jgi:hypothetical protein
MEGHTADSPAVQAILAILIGLGLAASCGLRVFVPMLVMSIAAKAGMLTLSDGFLWLASWPALIAVSLATAIEVGAYYVPWIDNALDTISAPTAAIAGTVLMAAAVAEFDPMLQWSLAVIAGGGTASLVSAGTAATRAVATATTGGLANFLVSTLELAGSLLLSLLALYAPIAGAIVLVLLLIIMFSYGRTRLRTWFWPQAAAAPPKSSADTR